MSRHVNSARLQPHEGEPTTRPAAKAPARRGRKPPRVGSPASFEARYPHNAAQVRDGRIDIGHDHCNRSFLGALDAGGVAWEGDGSYVALDNGLQAPDAGIAAWLAANG